MKKIMFMSLALAALMMASCGNKAQAPASEADSDSVAATVTEGDATAQKLSSESQNTVKNLTAQLSQAVKDKDSKATISVLANLQTIYKNLVDAGKIDEAKAYGTAVKNFINSNAETIKTLTSGNATIASLVEGIKNLPTSASATADEAKAAVVSDVVSLASPSIAKGATAVATAQAAAEALKNAPASVQAAATDAASNAVSKAKSTAEETATKAVNNAQEKAAEKASKAQEKAAEKVSKAQQKANEAVDKAAGKALKGLGL